MRLPSSLTLALVALLLVPAARAQEEESEVTWVVHDAVTSFGLYVNGVAVDLSDARYQQRSSVAQLRDADGTLIHTYWNGITFGMFLQTIGWSLDADCLVADTGLQYCRDAEGASTRAYLDGAEVELAALAAHELRGGETLSVVHHGPALLPDPARRPALVEGAAALLVGAGLAGWVAFRRRRPAADAGDAWSPSTRVLGVAILITLVGTATLAAAVTVFADGRQDAPPVLVTDLSLVVIQGDAERAAGYASAGTPSAPPAGWPASTAPFEADVRSALLGRGVGDAIEVDGSTWRIVSIVPVFGPPVHGASTTE